MVIRVILTSYARCVHDCKIFKSDDEAIEWLNDVLERFDLNDGQTLISREDIPAVNTTIAGLCDDPMNAENYVSFDDIEEDLLSDIYERFNEHHWSFETLMAMADDLGINFEYEYL